jgi:hypothetical protein
MIKPFMQALIQQALSSIPQEASIVAQLCQVEIVRLWIARLGAQQQEDVCDRQSADYSLQARSQFYMQAAGALAALLIPCMLRVYASVNALPMHAKGQGTAK